MIREICDVFKEAYLRGWITSRDGNASYRRPEQSWFYITPSGVRKNELMPEMCIKLDIDADGVDRSRWLSENDGLLKQQLNRGLQPSGELPMHWLLQRLNPSKHSRVVLHLHPTHIIAAMAAGISLEWVAEQFPEISRYTKVAKDIGFIEPVTAALGKAVAAELLAPGDTGELKADIVGLDRHGVVAVGRDPWECLEHIERLEHCCQVVLLAKLRPQ
jgi:ribulose-5-phosphate 4-epimerase/fuculose-1-phosphate aldolase